MHFMAQRQNGKGAATGMATPDFPTSELQQQNRKGRQGELLTEEDMRLTVNGKSTPRAASQSLRNPNVRLPGFNAQPPDPGGCQTATRAAHTSWIMPMALVAALLMQVGLCGVARAQAAGPAARQEQRDARPTIREFEGLRLQAYQDAVGVWTIGWGATNASPCAGNLVGEIREGLVITLDQAEALLGCHVDHVEQEVDRLTPADLPDEAKEALDDFVYNLGAGALERSTLLRRINDGDFCAAAAEFDRWVYADGVILPGLVRRRDRAGAAFGAAFQCV